jgi:hypothetical protein
LVFPHSWYPGASGHCWGRPKAPHPRVKPRGTETVYTLSCAEADSNTQPKLLSNWISTGMPGTDHACTFITMHMHTCMYKHINE